MNKEEAFVDFSVFNININEKDPMGFYWSHPSVVEIMGMKGAGKTALALQFCQQFSK